MVDYTTFGSTYSLCPDCDDTGYCMLYGHPCATLRCSGKPEEFQPEEDAE